MEVQPRSLLAPLALLALVVVAVVVAHGRASGGAAAQGREAGQVSAAERAATFHFDPAVAPADRGAFLRAVASARPQARRLIDVVDGLVDVHVATTEQGIAGTTQQVGARYSVTVNLGRVAGLYGERGIARTVLHELGHVVDFALVPPELDRQLDAAIPTGYGCDEQLAGSCASTVERFAESFAKWATGDIGVDLSLGYKVPPPADLDGWGAPLTRLAR